MAKKKRVNRPPQTATTQDPEPTARILLGTSFEEYRGLQTDLGVPYWNKSSLTGCSRCPRLAQAIMYQETERKQTDAFTEGSLIHTLVMEPHLFTEQFYVVSDDLKRNSKAGREAWADAEKTAGDRLIIKESLLAKAHKIATSLRGHPVAEKYLSDGEAEIVVAWHDPETGLPLKVRIDWVPFYALHRPGPRTEYDILVDIKTTRDASPDGFAKECAKYKYHWQDSLYRMAWKMATGRDSRFLFPVVEKEPPFLAAVYEIRKVDRDAADKQVRDAINMVSKQTKLHGEGQWDGFPIQGHFTCHAIVGRGKRNGIIGGIMSQNPYASNWVSAESVGDKEHNWTISEVVNGRFDKRDGNGDPTGEHEYKWVLSFEQSEQRMVLNVGNYRKCAGFFGNDPSAWIGGLITLYRTVCDFGKKKDVPCVRIKAEQPKKADPVEEISIPEADFTQEAFENKPKNEQVPF